MYVNKSEFVKYVFMYFKINLKDISLFFFWHKKIENTEKVYFVFRTKSRVASVAIDVRTVFIGS